MKWTIARARQHFSELLHAAARRPQVLYRRNRVVAVILDPAAYGQFAAWRERQEQQSLASAFAELRDICREEDYQLHVPPRQDRCNDFLPASE